MLNTVSSITNGSSISEMTMARLVQFMKAKAPIEVTLLGIVTEFRDLKPPNAFILIFFIVLGITISFISFPFRKRY